MTQNYQVRIGILLRAMLDLIDHPTVKTLACLLARMLDGVVWQPLVVEHRNLEPGPVDLDKSPELICSIETARARSQSIGAALTTAA